jgi:short-subunit dehydrogenase
MEAAKHFALLGHDVIVSARTPQACQSLVTSFQSHPRLSTIRALPLQLDSFRSVCQFRSQLTAIGVTQLDVLINSAAVMQRSLTRRMTEDGIEETLQVNALSLLLLTESLLGFLFTTAIPQLPQTFIPTGLSCPLPTRKTSASIFCKPFQWTLFFLSGI